MTDNPEEDKLQDIEVETERTTNYKKWAFRLFIDLVFVNALICYRVMTMPNPNAMPGTATTWGGWDPTILIFSILFFLNNYRTFAKKRRNRSDRGESRYENDPDRTDGQRNFHYGVTLFIFDRDPANIALMDQLLHFGQ